MTERVDLSVNLTVSAANTEIEIANEAPKFFPVIRGRLK
jgi:hypothetical protein